MTDGTPRDPHAPVERAAEFRFYAELNDFLPPEHRRRTFTRTFTGNPSVKDTIEALGVPHTEIDLILVNGRSVGFEHRLAGGERVAVYPMFERLDVSPATRLRPRPLRVTRFVLDVHLGTLARYLRLAGFDTVWRNDLDDDEIIEISLRERRIILTRDRGLLRHGRVTHGYWLRATDPLEQLEEVVHALHLAGCLEPFARCLECNGLVEPVDAAAVAALVPAGVWSETRRFTRCRGCGQVYWVGSHQPRLEAVIERARGAGAERRA
ncbi:MAG TPA: Mut7-C RNAse domain-containing protein [Gammaproteobacteria bacterium]